MLVEMTVVEGERQGGDSEPSRPHNAPEGQDAGGDDEKGER